MGYRCKPVATGAAGDVGRSNGTDDRRGGGGGRGGGDGTQTAGTCHRRPGRGVGGGGRVRRNGTGRIRVGGWCKIVS